MMIAFVAYKNGGCIARVNAYLVCTALLAAHSNGAVGKTIYLFIR